MTTPTPVEALDKLAAQGSARQIADHLIDEGCIGELSHGMRCPVARYIAKATGVAVYVDGALWQDHLGVAHVSPEAIAAFVVNFDLGGYPALIEEPA